MLDPAKTKSEFREDESTSTRDASRHPPAKSKCSRTTEEVSLPISAQVKTTMKFAVAAAKGTCATCWSDLAWNHSPSQYHQLMFWS